MRIGFLETYPNLKIPERENVIRIRKVMKDLGHDFFVLSPAGFDEDGVHADSLNLDFVFTSDNSVKGMEIMPDCPALSVGWVPFVYLGYGQFQKFVSHLDAFDGFVPAFESKSTDKILENYTNNFIKVNDYFYPSISKSDVIKPQRNSRNRIFYCGINLDRGKSKGRYYSLLKILDEKDILQLHGPDKIGETVCWEGFKNYNGEIPFDGSSIIKKINEAGICLALQSKIHNKEEYVTNRIYEACAAGAVIITDNNPKLIKFFGDSVYYVDVFQDEDKIIQDVVEIYNSIQSDPEKAFEKAKRSQDIFLNNFTLEKSVENLVSSYNQINADLINTDRQNKTVDVIAFVDSVDDFINIDKQIKKQYYKNVKVYFSTKVPLQITNATYKYELFLTTEEAYGKRFSELKKRINGDYFIFINGISDLQKRHFTKLVNKISSISTTYCMSKTYIKDCKGYTVLNDHTDNIEEYFQLFGFKNFSNERETVFRSFDLENKYALHSVLFKKETLDVLKESEIQNVRRAIHIYMILKEIYENNEYGSVLTSFSCGYNSNTKKTIIENKEYYIDLNEESFIDFNRCEGLSIVDLYTIFHKYSFYKLMSKSKCSEINKTEIKNILSEIASIENKIMICKIKKIFFPKKYKKKIQQLNSRKIMLEKELIDNQ